MAQNTFVHLAGRLAASTVLASLFVLGEAGAAAVAADTTSIDCLETAQVGPRPAGGDTVAAPAGKEEAVPVQRGTPGFRAYVDPETGEFIEPPEDAPAEVPTAAALSTSHEGLVAEPSAVPGGGIKVYLQGRLRSPLTATVDANGELRMQHTPCPGNSTQRK